MLDHRGGLGMFGLGKSALGIDTTTDPPLYCIMRRGLRRFDLTTAGTWPPHPMPSRNAHTVLLPYCSPAAQIAVDPPSESAADTKIIARSDSEGLVVTGKFEEPDLSETLLQDVSFSRLAYDICGLSLRHLIATHPAVLGGSPVVAIDWDTQRLLLVGIRGGRTAFCSYRAVPRNLGTIARELLHWNGEGLHVLLGGAGLRSPAHILDGLSSSGVSAELLAPGDLLGVHLEVAEPWRYSLCISMALGWLSARERDPFLVVEQNGSGGGRAPWFGWGIPLALLAVGAAGFGVGEKSRRATALAPPPIITTTPYHENAVSKRELNWQRLLWELATRMPTESSLLSVHAQAGQGTAILELVVRSHREDGGSVFLESMTNDGLFDHGVVHRIRARKQRDQDETVFDCDIRLETWVFK
jgi:hypothetical protein